MAGVVCWQRRAHSRRLGGKRTGAKTSGKGRSAGHSARARRIEGRRGRARFPHGPLIAASRGCRRRGLYRRCRWCRCRRCRQGRRCWCRRCRGRRCILVQEFFHPLCPRNNGQWQCHWFRDRRHRQCRHPLDHWHRLHLRRQRHDPRKVMPIHGCPPARLDALLLPEGHVVLQRSPPADRGHSRYHDCERRRDSRRHGRSVRRRLSERRR